MADTESTTMAEAQSATMAEAQSGTRDSPIEIKFEEAEEQALLSNPLFRRRSQRIGIKRLVEASKYASHTYVPPLDDAFIKREEEDEPQKNPDLWEMALAAERKRRRASIVPRACWLMFRPYPTTPVGACWELAVTKWNLIMDVYHRVDTVVQNVKPVSIVMLSVICEVPHPALRSGKVPMHGSDPPDGWIYYVPKIQIRQYDTFSEFQIDPIIEEIRSNWWIFGMQRGPKPTRWEDGAGVTATQFFDQELTKGATLITRLVIPIDLNKLNLGSSRTPSPPARVDMNDPAFRTPPPTSRATIAHHVFHVDMNDLAFGTARRRGRAKITRHDFRVDMNDPAFGTARTTSPLGWATTSTAAEEGEADEADDGDDEDYQDEAVAEAAGAAGLSEVRRGKLKEVRGGRLKKKVSFHLPRGESEAYMSREESEAIFSQGVSEGYVWREDSEGEYLSLEESEASLSQKEDSDDEWLPR